MATTANGTTYTVTRSGSRVLGMADASRTRRRVPTVLYSHGAGGTYDQFATITPWTGLRDWIVDNGWAWVESACGGAFSWGNDDARADQSAALRWADSQFSMGDVIVLGRSMGGLVAYWSYLYDPFIAPRAVGLMVNSGTTDLAYRVTFEAPEGDPSVLAAYGTDLAGFPAASAGHDPMQFPVEHWAGKHVLQLYGTRDSDVPAEHHALAWAAKYGATAATTVDVRQNGDHGYTNGSYLQVPAMTTFMASRAAPSLDPPAPPPRGRYAYRAVARSLVDPSGRLLPIPNTTR